MVEKRKAPDSDSETGEAARRRQSLALGLLYLLLTLLAIWIVHDFIPAVAWAAVIAIALWPLLLRLESWPRLRERPRLSAALLTALIGVVFIVPLGLAVNEAASDSGAVLAQMHEFERQGLMVPQWVHHLPFGGAALENWWQQNLSHPGQAALLARKLPRATLLQFGRQFGMRVAHVVVLFGFTLLVLFFMFAAGSRLRDQLLGAARRTFGADGAKLATKMAVSVRGTVSGLVLVGCGEGALLGIAYWFTGVPHAALLGAVSALAAMLPFCAPVLYGAAAIYLFLNGATLAAVSLAIVGTLIVLIAEHFVRPLLIGGSSRLPFLLVLFGILGGAETFGVLGIFIGPALMTVLMMFWQEWAQAPS